MKINKTQKKVMAALGREGGNVRAAKMTKKERSEAARKAAQARWGKK